MFNKNSWFTACLVVSLVLSCLDYENVLLCGLPDTLIQKLLWVQNSAARLMIRSGRRCHITPVLRSLHWLPICQRIEYKVLVLTFKGLHDYIISLLPRYQPARTLRSSSNQDFCVPSVNSRYGDMMFSAYAPRAWNRSPLDMKALDSLNTFRCHLKTNLFRQAYEC